MKFFFYITSFYNIISCFFSLNNLHYCRSYRSHYVKLKMNGAYNEFTKPFFQSNNVGSSWNYNDLLDNLKMNNIESVSILSNVDTIVAMDKNYEDQITGDNIHTIKTIPHLTDTIIDQLNNYHISFDIVKLDTTTLWEYLPWPLQLLTSYIILMFTLNIIRVLLMRGGSNMPGPFGNNPMSMLNSVLSPKSEIIDAKKMDVCFDDVAGCDEAKYELQEVVEFLKDPSKFENAGAKIPTGVLLEGPPGTGKTLLARAIAGESNCTFISASGSQFIELFVGVGASRVRTLFETAKENKPCIIFIDEIDAIGRQRGAGLAGGNDEREQTLNQILTNMDGFSKNDGIIVVAATNRADILDSALTRPGRFDRKIQVGLPDKDGRRKIMNIHFKNKKLGDDANLDIVADLTSGFSGAELQNLANEAAILTIRYKENYINNNILLDAFEKVTIGLPIKEDKRSNEILELIAYHETGHTIMVAFFKEFFDLRKITIIGNKNGAGGYTLFTPKEDYASFPTKKFMLANMIVALGGRAAEVVYYRNNNHETDKIFENTKDLYITTGASNDLKQANSIARRYVSLFGLSDDIGLYDSGDQNQPFLGRELSSSSTKVSEYTRTKIDKHIEDLVNKAYERAICIIESNPKNLEMIAEMLLNKKTIDGSELLNYNFDISKCSNSIE